MNRIIVPAQNLSVFPKIRRKILFYIVECDNCEDMMDAVNVEDIRLDDGFVFIDVEEEHPQTQFLSEALKSREEKTETKKFGVPSVLKHRTLYFATEGLDSDRGLLRALCKGEREE
jgi:hypothetical protein